jgi:uncharacterized protein (TIGR00661 family)
MSEKEKVLICPLDWGIGHATRCIPVISKFNELGYEVIVAASGRPRDFIRKEYPDTPVIDFPGFNIQYPKNDRVALKIIQLLPGMIINVWREHQILKRIAAETGACLIISDNRYGCWHASVPSVFITHQLNIQAPARLKFLQGVLNFINYRFIRKYNACWIPDFEAHRGLAGELSHPVKLPANANYIGILSRFSKRLMPFDRTSLPEFDILVMLSGPEPQRTILEEKILRQLVSINMQIAMVRGMPESEEAYVLDNRIHVFSHLDSSRLHELINRSALVICRSGYSSIMDMVTLGKRAIFIPTPGQTEQEYLARYLMEKKIYFSMGQSEFDLLYAFEMSKNYPGMMIQNNYKDLEMQIREIMKSPAPFGKQDT